MMNINNPDFNREKLLKKQKKAWIALFTFHKVTNPTIKEILDGENSPQSDKARAAIIKMYSYESNLYSSINTALCCKDRSKIPTLGPYACLLFWSVTWPPTAN